MISATSRSAQQRLDAVRSLAHLDAFDDAAYVAALRDEVTADAKDIAATDGAWAGVEAWDDRLRAALAAIDGYAARSMRIRLDHALADDTTVEPPFRTVLATTVLRYAGDLETLRERVVSVTARVDPAGAAATAAIVVACATTVHAARAALWDGVLGLARDLAAARVDHARFAARDPYAGDADRARWRAARRDLEQVAAPPVRIASARFADRVAALPPDADADADDEAAAAPPSREELIELD